ncbi:hypothetical protein IRP63_14995 (plasmid) [Clostridium botulinum]|uniref:Uncharacterized protein n=2 Tax=Clostridium botulinum TaxID=1491 RepID=A0A9Q1UXB6_CLOBO|nr:hypothetical protein [Clostridium botulinum]EDS76608.1 conserved hypothetical protein [Clostridium botulinum C str. Eklund]AEB77419.1 hypothetical protein CbC4_4219 [Clostridium botulinum BKT015925]KEH96405.1 hypothetical protein Y848_14100 [Clostridium botulinum C/D str. Sp77]KEH96606.1 hypothetical protein Z953_p0190 [Clostridium botulinum D str. 16868]KEH99888.1 hypothetical protein Z952_p0221 [Clostridium botulinum C/D str. BKT75002]
MSNTAIIIAMGSTAIVSAITEKVLIAFNKQNESQMVNIGGLSLVGCQAVLLVTKLIKACSAL